MRIIARSTLRAFSDSRLGQRDHAAVKAALEAWFAEAKQATWRNSADIKRVYAHASIVSADRVVFNIKGNDYRLVAAIDYERSIVWIKWIGSHGDYDRLDVKKVEHGSD
ncbi:type II toxin-antitoxin system HigB family toxin [Oceanibaculum pacificum]|uniref:Addiction module toxin RelE n=1 Tax=Oceanibaculum pacificum TaxID=580166 RepID=A0A154VAE0_9PROT|nr:type II toxin-antitoxin system HigB family toxin [Oceanibaculum pacificum]KZC98338.1 hypothetical protein AUP43_03935 [Oceanibaculum pacificum]